MIHLRLVASSLQPRLSRTQLFASTVRALPPSTPSNPASASPARCSLAAILISSFPVSPSSPASRLLSSALASCGTSIPASAARLLSSSTSFSPPTVSSALRPSQPHVGIAVSSSAPGSRRLLSSAAASAAGNNSRPDSSHSLMTWGRLAGAALLGSTVLAGGYVATQEPGTISHLMFLGASLCTHVVRLLDPELSHLVAVKSAALGLVPRELRHDPPSLRVTLWGRHFPNPVGLAAGFDKDATAVDGMLGLGFGFVEVGSVTPMPQEGNAKPRVFRLVEGKGVINRYGFNSEGIAAVADRLGAWRGKWRQLEKAHSVEEDRAELTGQEQRRHEQGLLHDAGAGSSWYDSLLSWASWTWSPLTGQKAKTPEGGGVVAAGVSGDGAGASQGPGRGLLAVNLGKNKSTEDAAADYVMGVHSLAQYADLLVINVSSPNTPGLRNLQGRRQLQALLQRVIAARDDMQWGDQGPPPLLLKIAPDLTPQDMADIAQVALSLNIDGLVVGNTTVSRPASVLGMLNADEAGGLSGKPLFPLSTHVLREMYRLTKGRIPIIGCGGIFTGEDAYEKIRAGATLVQIYTAMIYEGPAVLPRIKRELDECLRRDGFKSVVEAIGADHRILPK